MLRLLVPVTLDGRSQHVCYGLDKVGVVVGERAPLLGVRTQDAERALRTAYDHAYTAHHSVLLKQRRTAESSLGRSEEHTSELQSRQYLVCRLLLEKKKKDRSRNHNSEDVSH